MRLRRVIACTVLVLTILFLDNRDGRADRSCPKEHKEHFRDCILKKFSVGTYYGEMEKYLLSNGIKKHKVGAANRLYYRWQPRGLNLANYSAVVVADIDEAGRMTSVRIP